MRCIVIDDEPLALKLLEQYCSKVPSIKLLGTYSDPVDALSYIKALEPDLIFLDIHMPDLSGIEIASVVSKDTLIIFTTAYKEYAFEGFELDVVDYLLKPFDFERFLKAYTKAEERFRSHSGKTSVEEQLLTGESIAFKYNYQHVQLALSLILYIEASNNYVKIVTSDKTYLLAISMKSIEDMLPENRFVRIHKSYIVPINKIKSFSREKVVTDKIQLPVGRTYYQEFLEKMKSVK